MVKINTFSPDLQPSMIPPPKMMPTPTKSANEENGLPTSGLPKEFLKVITHISDVCRVPKEVALMGGLTVAGAALGGFIQSKVFNHVNPPCLWTMIVAPSGSGKTEPLSILIKPLEKIDQEMNESYLLAYALWEAEEAAATKKNPNTTPKPKRSQCVTMVATGAARQQLLNDNPRGALLFRDELRGMFQDLNSHNGTSDIEDLLTVYMSKTLKVDRVGTELRYAERPFMPIMGGIQTDVLNQTFSRTLLDNGLFARFAIVSFTPNRVMSLGSITDDSIINEWNDVIHRLWKMGDRTTLHTIEATPKATELYERLHCDLFNQGMDKDLTMSERHNSAKTMIYSKTCITVSRMALIAHMLRMAYAGINYPYIPIDADTISWAFSCAPYLCREQLKAYEIITGDRKRKLRNAKELITDISLWQESRGMTVNQTDIAKILGVSQSFVSNVARGNK